MIQKNHITLKNPPHLTYLMRVDLNLPYSKGSFDLTRLEKAKKGIDTYLKKGRVVLLAHRGRPKGPEQKDLSLVPLIPFIEEALHTRVRLADPLCVDAEREIILKECPLGEIILLENLRFYEGETKNDKNFAQALSKWGDIYIHDAFSLSHRAHASTDAITHYLPSHRGPTLKQELETLNILLKNPKRPLLGIVGGSKVSSKISVLTALTKKLDTLFIGGAMANTFLKARGYDVGKSLVEEEHVSTAQSIEAMAKAQDCKLMVPYDVCGWDNDTFFSASIEDISASGIVYDIGPKTIEALENICHNSATVLWNGPVGMFEEDIFAKGSLALAKKIADVTKNNDCLSVAGGGDTLALLNKAGVQDDFTHCSDGGGAFLEWLEEGEFPSLKKLMN
jgi:phosphoglycerate kinase